MKIFFFTLWVGEEGAESSGAKDVAFLANSNKAREPYLCCLMLEKYRSSNKNSTPELVTSILIRNSKLTK